jgi:hypothetical protein
MPNEWDGSDEIDWLTGVAFNDPEFLNIIVCEFDPEFDDEPDFDDDFPMSVEYDGLWGVSDFDADRASAEQDALEREFFGE